MTPKSWLCVECLGTAERVLLTDKRVRPYCAKHRPKDATAFRLTACGAVEEYPVRFRQATSVDVAVSDENKIIFRVDGNGRTVDSLTEPPKPEPKFKVGQWVRHVAGGLHEVFQSDEDICLVWLDQFKFATLRFIGDGRKFLSLALPRKGERWLSEACPTHKAPTPPDRSVQDEEFVTSTDFTQSWHRDRAECGCLVPVVG